MTMNENYREEKTHGNTGFPFDIYDCSIPESLPEVLPHWHDEMELIYVRNGYGSISVDNETKEIHGPALAIVFPGRLHSIRRLGEEPLDYRNLIFHPDLLYSKTEEVTDWEYLRPFFEGRFQVPSFIDLTLAEYSHLESPLELCGDRGDDLTNAYPLLAKSQLLLLFYHLLRLFPEKSEKSTRGNSNARIKTVLTYLMANYADHISVADAAAVAGFSEAYFMKYFRENMGVSFVTYLRNYRLSQAEERIRTTDLSILAIAQDTGFENFSYFIRNFKERYGTTPLQYRKQKG